MRFDFVYRKPATGKLENWQKINPKEIDMMSPGLKLVKRPLFPLTVPFWDKVY